MKCQNCNHKEAEVTFSFRHEDGEWELHLCQDCAQGMQQLAAAAFQELRRRTVAASAGRGPAPSWNGGEPLPQHGPPPEPAPVEFSPEAGQALRQRRRINQLQARLEDAVEREAYEDAAALRNEIRRLKQEGAIRHDQ